MMHVDKITNALSDNAINTMILTKVAPFFSNLTPKMTQTF